MPVYACCKWYEPLLERLGRSDQHLLLRNLTGTKPSSDADGILYLNAKNPRRAGRPALGHARRLRPVRCIMRSGGPLSEPDGSRALAQKDVGRTFARDVLRAFIAQSTHIYVIQEMLPGTE